jgi:hypothetical protein
MRKFQFEAEIYESLYCLPMAARRKLDRIGLKVSLEQWQGLSRAEHLAVCYMPANTSDECQVLCEVIVEMVKSRCGSAPKELPEESRRDASPPTLPPALLVERSRDAGFELNAERWDYLDEDERYALIKLGNQKVVSHNLAAALHELIR